MKIKNENIFQYFAEGENLDTNPTELGQIQFFEHQSTGKAPQNPDPYYLALTQGKWWFDFQTRELEQLYLREDEWWGFYQLWTDWKGNRWLLPHLCKWFPKLTGRKLPDWLGVEQSDKATLAQMKGDLCSRKSGNS